ncbi:MAG: DUF3842 family protein [bacterium]
MILAVVDGLGGGIGSLIIRRLRDLLGGEIEIIALGTNAIATSAMMKAGANRGASGENAIAVVAQEADILLGPMAVVVANSMMGELTPKMAEAISSARAKKILLPLALNRLELIGVSGEPLPHLVEMGVQRVKELIG